MNMNNKLKIRAWHKNLNRFLYFDEPSFDYNDGIEMYLIPNEDYATFRLGYLEYDDFIIQLFTGLTDSKGKDIYEGDILIYHPDYIESMGGQTEPPIGNVYFKFGCFYLGTAPLFEFIKDEVHALPEIPSLERIEIIGNIFQNPDLVKN